jgi:hypothetical protein
LASRKRNQPVGSPVLSGAEARQFTVPGRGKTSSLLKVKEQLLQPRK